MKEVRKSWKIQKLLCYHRFLLLRF